MSDLNHESVFDLPPDAAAADPVADTKIEAGKGVALDVVWEWLLRRAKGEKVPPPST